MAKPLLTDELWSVIEPGLPRVRPLPLGGRPRASDRACLSGIRFVLKTGIPWEDLPAEFGCCGMTCWRRLRDWQKAGVWTGLHRVLLEMLHEADQIDWSRTLVDSASVRTGRVGGSTAKPPPGALPLDPGCFPSCGFASNTLAGSKSWLDSHNTWYMNRGQVRDPRDRPNGVRRRAPRWTPPLKASCAAGNRAAWAGVVGGGRSQPARETSIVRVG